MTTKTILTNILSVLIIILIVIPNGTKAQTHIAFWNLENYYDTKNDSTINDDEFTPEGARHWNKTKYENKRNNIVKIIAAMQFPDIIGLAEVENREVLEDMIYGTPLRKMDYSIIHHDSPDKRGIDCALIYQRKKYTLVEEKPINVSDSLSNYYTRDILMACFVDKKGDTIYTFINHWPSKIGGALSDHHRREIAIILSKTMDSLYTTHPTSTIIAIGDFNTTYEELKNIIPSTNIRNLIDTIPTYDGSYNYHGTWQLIDNIIGIGCEKCHGAVYHTTNILEKDIKYLGTKPKRTYIGYKYNKGISDHLPIHIIIP